MANYYRITAYHKEKDISIIMDSYGLFEKKWQFSADLIRRGFDIIEVLSQNEPIQTVSKYMGHSDSTVTLEVYSHFIPDTQEKAVFALNNLTI